MYGTYTELFISDENKDETDESEDENVGAMVGVLNVSTDLEDEDEDKTGAEEARKVIPAGTVEGEVEDRERAERMLEMAASRAKVKGTREETKASNSGEDGDDEDTDTENIEVSDIITEAGTGSGEEKAETKEEETQTSNVSMTMTPMPSPVELLRSRETQEKKKVDFIPKERQAVEVKTADELRDDIKYVLKEFKPQLKEEAAIFKRVKNLDDLQRLHRRIIGKLQPDEQPKEEKHRTLEVDMERYIDERVQRLIMENMMNSVKPEAVMIDVEGQAQKKAKDVGSYELKVNQGGRMSARREPIYRAIPSTNPDEIDEQFDPCGSPAKVLKGAPTKKRTLATTAKRQFMQSLFRRPMQTIDLKYIA